MLGALEYDGSQKLWHAPQRLQSIRRVVRQKMTIHKLLIDCKVAQEQAVKEKRTETQSCVQQTRQGIWKLVFELG